jgi:hypothetical protein
VRPRIGFLIAAAMAAFTAGRHIIKGTPVIGDPIRDAETLSATARWMGFYVWHMASATVVLMALGFLWAGMRPQARAAGQLLSVLAALFAGLALWVSLQAHFPLEKVFPLHAFTLIALAGGWSSIRRGPDAER